MNLTKIIKSGESETVEFKKSTGEWREIIETISAFANTKGGIILIGVGEKKKVYGVSIGEGTMEDLTNKILNRTEPRIYPEIGTKTLNKKKIIYIKVDAYPYNVVLPLVSLLKELAKILQG